MHTRICRGQSTGTEQINKGKPNLTRGTAAPTYARARMYRHPEKAESAFPTNLVGISLDRRRSLPIALVICVSLGPSRAV